MGIVARSKIFVLLVCCARKRNASVRHTKRTQSKPVKVVCASSVVCCFHRELTQRNTVSLCLRCAAVAAAAGADSVVVSIPQPTAAPAATAAKWTASATAVHSLGLAKALLSFKRLEGTSTPRPLATKKTKKGEKTMNF